MYNIDNFNNNCTSSNYPIIISKKIFFALIYFVIFKEIKKINYTVLYCNYSFIILTKKFKYSCFDYDIIGES